MQAIYRYSRGVVLILVFALVSGCGDDTPDDGQGQGEVELGTGALNFESLAEGAPLVLVPGIQGGHHFVVNARIHDLLPGNSSVPNELGNPLTSFAIFDGAGERIDAPAPPYRLGYRESAETPWFELPSGRILRVNQDLIDADPQFLEELYESEVSLRVTVVDARGDQATHERQVRPQEDARPPPGTPADAGP